MKVELVHPESVREPRHWVRHDQAFAMMLRPGSIEWGSKRSALEKFDYAPGDLALCDRHIGEWVGLIPAVLAAYANFVNLPLTLWGQHGLGPLHQSHEAPLPADGHGTQGNPRQDQIGTVREAEVLPHGAI